MSKTLKTGTHAVLTTMLMKNKDIDAMNRVGFVGAQDDTITTTFNGVDADQGTIVKMGKMVKYAGHDKIEDTGVYQLDHDNSRSFGEGEGYSWEVAKASADDEGDLWIIDNHEVAYNVEYQQRVSIDPRFFCNEAGRAVSCRKLSKGDIIQISVAAFTANNAPDMTPTTAANRKDTVVIDAGGQLKAIKAGDLAQGKHAVFKVIGKEPMEFGYDRVDAWILEATQYAD